MPFFFLSVFFFFSFSFFFLFRREKSRENEATSGTYYQARPGQGSRAEDPEEKETGAQGRQLHNSRVCVRRNREGKQMQ